jgi:hypothetical protein
MVRRTFKSIGLTVYSVRLSRASKFTELISLIVFFYTQTYVYMNVRMDRIFFFIFFFLHELNKRSYRNESCHRTNPLSDSDSYSHRNKLYMSCKVVLNTIAFSLTLKTERERK